ncbi:ABC transporter ATP-binding protein/permease [Synechococcus sp. AH-551-N23]|nr:ABC transporter ATP-binding protein/permease [Synechococcus sp. AH-551-N23]
MKRNSAAVITASTSQINLTVMALNSLLQLITSSVVATGLFTGLLLVDPPVAVGAVTLFGVAYGSLAVTSRRELRRNGEKIAEASSQQVKALQEGLGAIREVLLNGTQTIYFDIYQQADRPQRQLLAKNVFLSSFPRYSLEALGMVAIALLGGLLVLQRGSGASVIPLLGAFALGAQRLLPALQQIYSGWATLKGRSAAIQSVLAMLNQPLPPVLNDVEPLSFNSQISLNGVHFRYDSNSQEVLQSLDLQIRVGERLGIIGNTGSGKSTTVDILMGLLSPTAGSLMVDGIDLHDPNHPERLAAWRASIAHVPQTIYLADSSIAENIAFGVPHEKIDFDRVKQAASQAQIASFIESCSDGYESFVGERGIRLSGGQRQRIGVARALYKQAPVLIFDEATSALDASTERELINSVESLNENLTVVMIAHRLSTLECCDRVIQLYKGCVRFEGTPDQVLKNFS